MAGLKDNRGYSVQILCFDRQIESRFPREICAKVVAGFENNLEKYRKTCGKALFDLEGT